MFKILIKETINIELIRIIICGQTIDTKLIVVITFKYLCNPNPEHKLHMVICYITIIKKISIELTNFWL